MRLSNTSLAAVAALTIGALAAPVSASAQAYGYSRNYGSGAYAPAYDYGRYGRQTYDPCAREREGRTGAGAVIALASDLRVFSERAKIAFLFTNVGLTGADMGAGYLLPRVVGLGRATELLMLGSSIDAPTAERYGLATQVVPPGECLPTALALAERLAAGPLAALATTKRMLNSEWALDLDEAIEAEAVAQAFHLRDADHKEFHSSFVEKRSPRFSGNRSPEAGADPPQA